MNAGVRALVDRRAPTPMSLTRLGDSVFLDVNDAMAQMLGYARDEMVGKSAYDLGIWRDPPREDVVESLRATGSARGVELTYHRKDGERRHCVTSLDVVDHEGTPAVLAACVDITARIRAEEARSRLLAAVESADDAIMTIDTRARFLTWNKGCERLFGYTAAEVVGRDGQMLIPKDLPDEGKIIADALGKHGALRDYETRRVRKDGSVVDVSVSISVVKGEDGQLLGFTGVMRDISARKRAEEEARRQLVARRLVRTILRALSEQTGTSAATRRTLGQTIARDLVDQPLESALVALRDMGLGEIALARADADRYEFRAQDLLEVTKGHTTPTCHMALGALEAIVGHRHGGAALGSELKCQSQGEPACVFMVKPRA